MLKIGPKWCKVKNQSKMAQKPKFVWQTCTLKIQTSRFNSLKDIGTFVFSPICACHYFWQMGGTRKPLLC